MLGHDGAIKALEVLVKDPEAGPGSGRLRGHSRAVIVDRYGHPGPLHAARVALGLDVLRFLVADGDLDPLRARLPGVRHQVGQDPAGQPVVGLPHLQVTALGVEDHSRPSVTRHHLEHAVPEQGDGLRGRSALEHHLARLLGQNQHAVRERSRLLVRAPVGVHLPDQRVRSVLHQAVHRDRIGPADLTHGYLAGLQASPKHYLEDHRERQQQNDRADQQQWQDQAARKPIGA